MGSGPLFLQNPFVKAEGVEWDVLCILDIDTAICKLPIFPEKKK